MIGKRHQLVVVKLYDERNFMGILSRNRSQQPNCGSDAVATAVDSQVNNMLRIEAGRIFSK